MRVQRRFLLRSRWTASVPLPDSVGECHFEVIEVRGDVVKTCDVKQLAASLAANQNTPGDAAKAKGHTVSGDSFALGGVTFRLVA